ncbi:MAG: 3-deoxy-7-phosphoheptulonate synthase [Gemmatimonadetes bacterium]|nr:MAG: 3-deoxy-7-phosphoheptulonate synthase [Gemmatimonadota bacterium]PYP07684.1 MAG: 3-deoxy-7-phosphoheptulonate synthase [Gemmatimonadota bacterium]
MIIVMRAEATAAQRDGVREQVEASGGRSYAARDGNRTVLGCLGDTDALSEDNVEALPGVESVTRWRTPYRLASRELAPPGGRTVVRIGDGPAASVGGPALLVVAGPCSVEGPEMLLATARGVARAGAAALRGGAFKPRTSPYAFQGLGLDALRWLAEVRRVTGLPVVTEVLDPRQVELVAAHADVLQVGARSMQNFPLLAEVGRVRRPVLLKRAMSATVTELLLAAEYVLARGNPDVILCERGIRTFEPATRNTLDIAAIPVLRGETHLPVIVDPSHAGGRADLVAPLAYAAIAAGADGLLVEVHPRPETALSDGEQSLSLDGFTELMRGLAPFAAAAGRTLVPQPKALPEVHALKGRLGPTCVLEDAPAAEAV